MLTDSSPWEMSTEGEKNMGNRLQESEDLEEKKGPGQQLG